MPWYLASAFFIAKKGRGGQPCNLYGVFFLFNENRQQTEKKGGRQWQEVKNIEHRWEIMRRRKRKIRRFGSSQGLTGNEKKKTSSKKPRQRITMTRYVFLLFAW